MHEPPVIRAFIAINLSAEIRLGLERVTSQLKQRLVGVPIRWIAANNIHLTLKFLGNVSWANQRLLEEILQAEISAHEAFELSVGGLGAFPTLHLPRVIWVKVTSTPGLIAIQRRIEAETTRLGYNREERLFSPHLTLGRVSRIASPQDLQLISEVIKTSDVGFLGALSVNAVSLYRSELKPGGAVYTELFKALLAPAAV